MSRVGLAIFTLYVLSIPWYRSPGAVPNVVFGVPDWVAVAVACYVAIACLTALTWRRIRFDESDEDEPDEKKDVPDP